MVDSLLEIYIGDLLMTTEKDVSIENRDKKYIDAIFWGGILIWAGLIFGVDYLGYLPEVGEATEWSWIFIGAGFYGLLISFARLLSESLSNPTTWDWIWSVVFLIIGGAGFLAVNVPWWLILIIFGVAILGNALLRRDQS